MINKKLLLPGGVLALCAAGLITASKANGNSNNAENAREQTRASVNLVGLDERNSSNSGTQKSIRLNGKDVQLRSAMKGEFKVSDNNGNPVIEFVPDKSATKLYFSTGEDFDSEAFRSQMDELRKKFKDGDGVHLNFDAEGFGKDMEKSIQKHFKDGAMAFRFDGNNLEMSGKNGKGNFSIIGKDGKGTRIVIEEDKNGRKMLTFYGRDGGKPVVIDLKKLKEGDKEEKAKMDQLEKEFKVNFKMMEKLSERDSGVTGMVPPMTDTEKSEIDEDRAERITPPAVESVSRV